MRLRQPRLRIGFYLGLGDRAPIVGDDFRWCRTDIVYGFWPLSWRWGRPIWYWHKKGEVSRGSACSHGSTATCPNTCANSGNLVHLCVGSGSWDIMLVKLSLSSATAAIKP